MKSESSSIKKGLQKQMKADGHWVISLLASRMNATLMPQGLWSVIIPLRPTPPKLDFLLASTRWNNKLMLWSTCTCWGSALCTSSTLSLTNANNLRAMLLGSETLHLLASCTGPLQKAESTKCWHATTGRHRQVEQQTPNSHNYIFVNMP